MFDCMHTWALATPGEVLAAVSQYISHAHRRAGIFLCASWLARFARCCAVLCCVVPSVCCVHKCAGARSNSQLLCHLCMLHCRRTALGCCCSATGVLLQTCCGSFFTTAFSATALLLRKSALL